MPSPTHVLVAKRKGAEHGNAIGVAWKNESKAGRTYFSLRLNACVVISHADDVELRLFESDSRHRPAFREPSPEDKLSSADSGVGNTEGEEIPF